MMTRLLLFSFVLFCSARLLGQAGTVDTTFNSVYTGNAFTDQSGTDFLVRCITKQADGKVLISGDFSEYNGYRSPLIVRLNSDGAVDETFISLAYNFNSIYKIAVQTDGKIIIVGDFSTYGDSSRRSIARLNTDGSLDLSFFPGTGTYGFPSGSPIAIRDVVIQPDGKLIIGGDFTEYNGVGVNYLARLESNGSLDPTFQALIGNAGWSGSVKSLSLQSDGKILIGGNFQTIQGIARNNIARLESNGLLDQTFTIGSGPNYDVQKVELFNNGDVLIGGMFDNYNGQPRRCLAKLSSTGAILPDISPITLAYQYDNPIVRDILIQANGSFIAVGKFQSSSINQTGITKVLANGSVDPSFSVGLGSQDQNLHCIDSLPNGNLMIGGEFSFNLWDNNGRNNLVCLNQNGAVLSELFNVTGANSYIHAIDIQLDNKIIAVGSFQTYQGVSRKYIMRLHPNGTLDDSFILTQVPNAYISSVAIQPDGKILIGGFFTLIGNVSRQHIARLNADGTLDLTFNPGTGTGNATNTTIEKIVPLPNGKILIAGGFTEYNQVSVSGFTRLNSNGSLDLTFTPWDINCPGITDIILQPNGQIIVGGFYGGCFGDSYYRVARLNINGTLDPSFETSTVFNYQPRKIKLDENGRIVVAGDFTQVNFISQPFIARLNANGTLDNSFAPSVNGFERVGTPILQPDGKILAVATMVSSNNVRDHSLIRMNSDGSIDPSFNSGSGFNDYVWDAKLQPNGQLIVGGYFTNYNSTNKNRIIRINNDVEGFSNLDLYFSEMQDVGCAASGIAIATAVGGSQPYQYSWNLGSLSIDDTVNISSSGIYEVTVTDGLGDVKTASLFVDGPVAGDFDILPNIIANEFRPGFENTTWVDCFNKSCTSVSGQLKLVMDPLVTFNSANPAPSSVIGDTLIWDFYNSTFDSAHFVPQIEFTTSTNAVIGDFVQFTAITIPNNGDADSLNNIKVIEYPIVNGYDPNNKLAYPVGECIPHFIDPEQTITYTVQFQNTGNSEAINIYILDTLDADLDLSTLRIVAKSHEMITEVLSPSTLKFRFDGIYLPDSTNNEISSHGYVVFEIKPLPNLANGTSISNDASIFFDFNPPILTNSVYHTISNQNYQSITDSVTEEACQSFSWNNEMYYESGTYIGHLQNSFGCDSTVILQLTIHENSTTDSVTQGACESFSWNNETYYESGTYIGHLQNSFGCDSTVILQLTILENSESELFIDAIDSYELNGITYTTSGDFDQTLTNANGCDSILTLHLSLEYTGVSEQVVVNTALFPNPASDYVKISFEVDLRNETILITDLQGKVVLRKEHINGLETTIDVSGLSNGVYLIRTQTSPALGRLVKQ